MKREKYRSILGQLPIKSPTPADMAKLCPHLTTEEAVKAFTTGSGYVACPSLLIRNSFQIVSFRKEEVGEITVSRVKDSVIDASITGKKNYPSMLSWAYAGRTLKSYADGKSQGDVFSSYKHMDKAMKFAEDNWGDQLVLDNWNCVMEIYIQDPTDLVNDVHHKNYPRTKTVLRFALSRDLNEIINDHSKPESELFDDAIVQMTIDHLISAETKGGRGGHTQFNCAHCGAGLSLTSCTGCGHRFKDDQLRCGWHTPLSQKMVAFLRENGRDFKIDPSIALEKEKHNWESV